MGIAPAVLGFDGRSGNACAVRGSAPWASSAAVATPPVFMNVAAILHGRRSDSFLFMAFLPTGQGPRAALPAECSGKPSGLVPGGEAGR